MKQASKPNEASFVYQWSLLHILPQFLLLPDSNDKRYNSIIEKYQKDSNSVCLDEIQFLGDYYPKKLKNDSNFLKCCHVYYIWFLSLSLFKDFYAKTLNDVIFNFRWNVITLSCFFTNFQRLAVCPIQNKMNKKPILLCEVLCQTSLAYGFAYNIGVHIFFELGFHGFALWCTSFTPKFIFHIVCWYQFHLCHNAIELWYKDNDLFPSDDTKFGFLPNQISYLTLSWLDSIRYATILVDYQYYTL